jgi:quinol monooxygenase YgiN
MLVLFVQVEVRQDMLDEFLPLLRDNASKSPVEDAGCHRFDVYQEEGTTTRFVYHEVYDDEAAWMAHRQSAHFLAYNAVAVRALVSRVVTRLQPARL